MTLNLEFSKATWLQRAEGRGSPGQPWEAPQRAHEQMETGEGSRHCRVVRSTRDSGVRNRASRTHEEYMGGINTDAPISKPTPPVHFQSGCTTHMLHLAPPHLSPFLSYSFTWHSPHLFPLT